MEGAYVIAVMEKGNLDTLAIARKSCSLVIGIEDGETFIASDATIIGLTDKAVYLKDNENAYEVPHGAQIIVRSFLLSQVLEIPDTWFQQ